MRRWILAAVVVGFAVSMVPAQAEPGVPRHHHSETRPITGVVRSVVVSGDYSNIAVTTGPKTVVTATEAWNFTQPKLSVSLSHKVLKVDIRCDDGTSLADTVFLDGGNLLNDCTDDLRLTVPVRVALRAKTYLGNVSAQGVHGVQRLRSGAGSITVRDGGGRSVSTYSGQGDVMASHLRGGVVTLKTDAGSIAATDVTGSRVTLDSGQGDLAATRVAATSASVETEAGNVTVDSLAAEHRTELKSWQGSVTASGLRSAAISAASDAGDVTLANVRSDDVDARSGQGTVKVQHVVTRSMEAKTDAGDVELTAVMARTAVALSGQGRVTGRALDVRALTATSDAGIVDVYTINAPTAVTVRSGQGDVSATVANSTYDVRASSGQGRVTVEGLTIYSRASRSITAHSDAGDVTVRGH